MTAPEARPIFFGDNQQLFGWYHPARSSSVRDCSVRDCSVVLCPPIGHEYMASHRAFRHLAEQLADAGFAALRLDYYGTGDALGGPREDGLVHRWQDNIAAAIDELRAHSGAKRVVLLGLRVGATLAALTASRRSDVDALVLWSPSSNGRSYVREVMMLGKATPGATQETTSNDGSIEAGGFLLSRSTSTDLSAVKLAQLSFGSLPRGLLLSRDDLPPDDTFADHLRRQHVEVTQLPFSGYSAFMAAPVKSVLPTDALEKIVAWLSSHYPLTTTEPLPSAHSPSPTGRPARVHAVGDSIVHEEAVRFGPGLFGILTTPATRDPRQPGIVLMNTGGDHHVGPHRMYAPLVRQWAAMGFSTLRFDIGGLGESPARPGESEAVAYPPNAIDDLSAAIAYFGAVRQIGRYIVMGICSGAYYSVHAASAGLPITGNIAVNPPLYWRPGQPLDEDPYWTTYETKRVSRALLSPAKWARLLRGRVDFRATATLLIDQIRRVGRQTVGAVQRGVTRGTGERIEEDLLMLFPDRVDTLLTFSKDDLGLKYLEGQNDRQRQQLEARPNFTLQIVEGADHTFMPVQWQDRLSEFVTAHLVERYGPAK